MMRCTICRRIINRNRSGLCAAHYSELARVAFVERNAAIIAARKAGETVASLAARFDTSPSNVRAISYESISSVPMRRIADLIASVCQLFDTSRADLIGPRRHHHLIGARHAVYYLATKAGNSTTKVGKALHRHHTTVMHGRDAAEHRAARDHIYAAKLSAAWSGEVQQADVPGVDTHHPAAKSIHKLNGERDYDMERVAAINAGIARGSAGLLDALRRAA